MNALLWKQWRENRFYLAVFIACMVLATFYSIGYEAGYRFRAAVGSFSAMAMIYSGFAAVFLAMRTAQGEQTDGTMLFSASLPVSLRRIAVVRIGVAAAVLAIPVLLGAVVMSFALMSGMIEQAAPRGIPYIYMSDRVAAPLSTSLEQLWSVAMIAVLFGVELLLVLSLCGCGFGNQAQVGFLGAVMFLGTILATPLIWFGQQPRPEAYLIYGTLLPSSLAIQWGYRVESGSYTDHQLAEYRWWAMALSSIVLVVLGWLFTTQYGRIRNRSGDATYGRIGLMIPALWSYVPIRFHSRLIAMIWLELRQSLPLAFFGLLFAILIAFAGEMMDQRRPFSTEVMLGQALPGVVIIVGMLWAVVVGSALYSADLGERLGTFWRSRPISPQMWFWCKFTVGLVAVLVVLDGATIALAWSASNNPRRNMGWAYVACFPILHAWMYSLTVLGTCWLRRPAISGFLAIFSYALLTLALETLPITEGLEPLNLYELIRRAENGGLANFFAHEGYLAVYGSLAASFALFAALSSRLAMTLEPNKQGWRSS